MLGSKKIRFIRPWGQYRSGDIIQPAALMREELIRRGFAELLIEDAPECAAVEPATEKAVLPQPVKRKRGRPRKYPLPT